ncbi:MAG: type II secretion system F family protein [Victivallales bacterium]|nr:type II secretion system F family protein [Victivallales bacterium]
MAQFVYEIAAEDDVVDAGIISAANRDEAMAQLPVGPSRRICRLNVISEPGACRDDRPPVRSAGEKRLCRIFIGPAQLEHSLQQLATLLASGVPILSSLRIIAAQSSGLLGRAYYCVGRRLLEGGQLADILAKEMPFIGEEAVGMIAAGEANGDIDRMCRYAAELMYKRRRVRSDILQAMAYPAVVLVVASGVVTFLIKKVIPKIMKFLEGRSGKLPAVTQALVDVTHFLEHNGIWLLVIPAALVVLLVLLRRQPQLAPKIDYALLRLPLLGQALAASANALWTRTFGILLGSGIGIIEALQFTENAQSNRYYRRELQLIRQLVGRGHSLSLAVRASGLRRLEPMTEAMVMVGENTGRLDEGLHRIADFSEQRLQQRIALLSKMIEPVLFVVVGGIVGFVYIAFFLGLMAASSGGR